MSYSGEIAVRTTPHPYASRNSSDMEVDPFGPGDSDNERLQRSLIQALSQNSDHCSEDGSVAYSQDIFESLQETKAYALQNPLDVEDFALASNFDSTEQNTSGQHHHQKESNFESQDQNRLVTAQSTYSLEIETRPAGHGDDNIDFADQQPGEGFSGHSEN